MIIDNGTRETLVIDGVFDGVAGCAGAFVSFVPNRYGKRPGQARAGILAGVPVRMNPIKDEAGPFWTARFEVMA